MGILKSIARVFTWWDGQTLNTQFWTWRKGVRAAKAEHREKIGGPWADARDRQQGFMDLIVAPLGHRL